MICEESELLEMPFDENPSRETISSYLKETCNYHQNSFQSILHRQDQKVLLVAFNQEVDISIWKNFCINHKIELRFFEFEAIIVSRLIFEKFPKSPKFVILGR